MIAVIDESILLAGHGAYVLGCVVIRDELKAGVRREARRVVPTGRRQFHWSNEQDRERFAMVGLLGRSAALIAAVRRPVTRGDHEASRAEQLAAVLDDLGSLPVLDVLIESRQAHNDQRDRHVIAVAQRSDRVRPDLSYGHADPRVEPLLWLADALAGAVTADFRGRGEYLAALPDGLLTLRRTGD